MIAKAEIKQRAVNMAITTGKMPNVDLIWMFQRDEHNEECFGRGMGCRQRGCRWRSQCVALDFYAEAGGEREKAEKVKPAEPLPRRGMGVRNRTGAGRALLLGAGV